MYSTKWRKKRANIEDVERVNVLHHNGLSTEIVNLRIEQGLTNKRPNSTIKTTSEILRTNFLSFFNILLYVIGAALIAVKEYTSLFFLVILASNIFIGTFQDLRARATLKRLLILNAHKVTVVRNGKEELIDRENLVLDDIVKLKSGDQIPADGYVAFGAAGINEALLTGEPEIIHKKEGALLLSGSFVSSGNCYYRVDKVGDASYAQTIQLKAKLFKRPTSELLTAISRLFKVINIFVIAIGILMIFSTIFQGNSLVDSVKSISGSLVGMIPSGMYLLTSMTLAVGVIRLGNKNTLVNEMYSIEMLARVDVLCLDKTGTITDGTMNVKEVIALNGYNEHNLKEVISSLLHATQDENPTAVALKNFFKCDNKTLASEVLHFSSENKCSGVVLEETTYVLGASSSILNKQELKIVQDTEKQYLLQGLRVLTLARSKQGFVNKKIPADLEPVALLVLQDTVRLEAIEAIRWFQENGVVVKIISGDDPISVSEIARQVGVENADKFIDLSKVTQETEYISKEYTVYGRVKPEEKEVIIQGLQKAGHTVAMIGDGVNDVLALKAADCSIAMGKGSGAARGVSHLALLEDNFDALPSIVDEGRRAINNLQKTWSLFLVKTIFAISMSLIFLFAGFLTPIGSGIRYPFETKNLYIWEFFTIGVASFWLSVQPNHNKVSGTFITNVAKRAIPGGVTIVVAVCVIYLLRIFDTYKPGIVFVSDVVAQTMAVITMTFLSFVVLFRNSLPFNRYRLGLFFIILIAAVAVMAGIGLLKWDLLGITYDNLVTVNYIQIGVINIVAAAVYAVIDRSLLPQERKGAQDEN